MRKAELERKHPEKYGKRYLSYYDNVKQEVKSAWRLSSLINEDATTEINRINKFGRIGGVTL